MPKVLPPAREHDHAIHLQPRSVPPNIKPYRYPYDQKSEIERLVVEMLEASIIQPSQSTYSIPMVMVPIKNHAWCMCLDYRDLKRMSDSSLKISFIYLSLVNYKDQLFLPNWIFVQDIIKS